MSGSSPSLKPQDLLVVLGVHVLGGDGWTYETLAKRLRLSPSEAHSATQRAIRSRLLDGDAHRIRARNVLEFLEHGVPYAFPVEPGQLTRGIPTAASAPPLKGLLLSDPAGELVWPHADGSVMGQTIVPLYRTVPDVALQSSEIHALLSLVDALRLGRVRDRELAMAQLRARLQG
jgi:hypothetical protein